MRDDVSSGPRKPPTDTQKLSKPELTDLIQREDEHGEPELEVLADATPSRMPVGSSPKLAHTRPRNAGPSQPTPRGSAVSIPNEPKPRPTAQGPAPRVSMADMAPTEQFGQYQIYERLGLGGMAMVHRAKMQGIAGFERVVALKRMLTHLNEDEAFVESFIREAKVASMLMHPNIAQVYDFGRVGGVYFIAMELVPGVDLRKILQHANRSGEPIPLAVVISLMTEICEALEHAHTFVDESGACLNIIHRDVSPSNLLVDGNGHLKVIDFGIAKASSQQLHTQSGKVKGKLGYMSPEAAMGMTIGPNSDVFSAGVVAWELLTAWPLFSASTDFETMRRIRESEIPAPSSKNSTCPPELDAVVLAALDRDPNRRFQSAGEFRQALDQVAAQYGIRVHAREVAEWVERLTNPDAAPRNSSQRIPVGIGTPVPGSLTSAAKPAARGSKQHLLASPEAAQVAAEIWGGEAPRAVDYGPSTRPSAPNMGGGLAAPIVSAQLQPQAPSSKGKMIAIAAALAVVGGAGIYVTTMGKSKPDGGAAAASSVTATAQVRFTIQPEGAIVEIGGRQVGNTGAFETAVEPGMYSIVVRKDGYKRWVNSVSLRAGEPQTINVALERGIAQIAIDSKPQGLVVMLDGKLTEYKTPARFEAPAGPHQLKLTNAAGETWSEEFNANVDGMHQFNAMIGANAREQPSTSTHTTSAPSRPSGGRDKRGNDNQVAERAPETKPAAALPEIAVAAPVVSAPVALAPVATPAIAKQVPPTAVAAPALAQPTRMAVVGANAVAKLSGEIPKIKLRGGSETDGEVLAKMCIDEQGRVSSVKVVKSSEDMSNSLSSALMGWRYRPYIKDGKAAPVCFPLSLRIVGQ